MKLVYLLCGVPCSGKTWICDQLTSNCKIIRHDNYERDAYLMSIEYSATHLNVPIIAETPFSVNEIKQPLEEVGIKVVCLFVIEKSSTISNRYMKREGKQIPQRFLNQLKTFEKRAHEWRCFFGTSKETLEHLKNLLHNNK